MPEKPKSLTSHPVPEKAGRELDAIIAEKVMGWRDVHPPGERNGSYWYVPNGRDPENGVVCSVPEYSTRIADAWSVVEKLRGDGWVYCTVQSFPAKAEEPEWDDSMMRVEWWAEFSRYRSPVEATSPHCETPALAICLAALSAFRVPLEKEEK